MKESNGQDILSSRIARRYIRTVANDADLEVIFSDASSSPYTDGKTVYIPEFNSYTTQEDVDKLKHFVLHEALHHSKGKEFFDILRDNGLSGEDKLGTVANIFEDNRIEKLGSRDYRGDNNTIERYMDIAYNSALKFLDENEIDADNPEHVGMFGSLGADMMARARWSPTAQGYVRRYMEKMPEPIRSKIEELEQNGVLKSLYDSEDVDKTFDISKKIFEHFFEESAEEHIEQCKAEQGGNEGSGSEEEEGDEGGSQQGKGKGDEEKPRTEWEQIPYEPLSNPKGTLYEPSTAPLDIDYSNYKRGRYSCPGDVTEKDMSKSVEPLPERIARGEYPPSQMVPDRGFGNKVRRSIQIKSYDRRMGGYKSGNIHGKRLWRAGMPRVGDGEWNRKVFRRKEENDTLDTAVSVLIDYSGSMGGEKIENAIEAGMLLNSSISRQLGIPVRITGFSDHIFGDGLTLGVFKNFDQRVGDEEMATRMVRFTCFMGQNSDGEYIAHEYYNLKKRPEKRKIFIVLSDGQPAGMGGDDMWCAKEVVKSIENDKEVEIYGIGIMSSAVKEIYKERKVINSANQLERALLDTIKRKIV